MQGIDINCVDTVNYVYNEDLNEIVLEGTGIRWYVLRLNKYAVEFFAARSQHLGTF